MNTKLAVIFISMLLVPLPQLSAAQEADQKIVALGDVEIGQNYSGRKAYEVKETIQFGLKKELEKKGKGRYAINIVSPTTTAKGAPPEPPNVPDLPKDRMPTQKELAQFAAAMQKMQKEMSGEVKAYSPVSADAFFDFRIESGIGGGQTSGAAGMVGEWTGLDTSAGDIGMKTTKVYLIATMRNPKDGTPIDKYTAKATSVKFRNVAGYTDYDYGSDEITRERLFSSAVKQCAKWIDSKLQ